MTRLPRLVAAVAFLLVVLVMAPVAASALTPGSATITGTVTDASSAAVAGALVRVCDPLPANTGCLPPATTDGNGAYTLTGVPENVNMSFQVLPPSGSGLLRHDNGLTMGSPLLDHYDVTLPRAAVDGYVTGPGNTPVADVPVNLGAIGGPGGGSGFSGPDGYYSVGATDFLNSGTYNVSTQNNGAGGLFDQPPVAVSVTSGSTTRQDLALLAGGSVQGTVTGPGGVPAVGIAVGLSTGGPFVTGVYTDANGHYATNVVVPRSYTLQASPPVDNYLLPASQPITVVSGVTSTADLVLPLGGRFQADVLKADLTPYPAGVAVVALCQGPLVGTSCLNQKLGFADATGHVVINRINPGSWDVYAATLSPFALGPKVTISVAAGLMSGCTFIDLVGACGQPDDADGVGAAVEDGAPNGGDGNADGIPDSSQPNVSSLPSSGAGAPYVSIATPAGTTITGVTTTDPTTLPQAPNGALLPVGVLGFSVRGIPTGAAIDVEIYTPTGTSPTSYLKYQNGWIDFSTHASFSGDVVTLHLVDGGAGDADGLANGVIVDPGAPAVVPATFGGFAPPVKNPPAVNSANAGATVPVKFSLGGYQGMQIFAAGFPKSQPCGSTTASSILGPGASALSYDANSDLYTINWKTQKAWAGTCRELLVKFADGRAGTATFAFK